MSEVIRRLSESADTIDRETAATLRAWQDSKAADGRKRTLGRLPGQINKSGCVAVISATVRRQSIGFEEVGAEHSFVAIVDRHWLRFEPDVVQLARQRLLRFRSAQKD